MVEDRKLAVLRAIVEDYVATQEPVGSKALVDRHQLGVSPATVRNDMAALEEEGFITQPHTSAGRIPTDKGYRLFVDRLAQIKPLSPAERKAISTFLEGAVDLGDVLTDDDVAHLRALLNSVLVGQPLTTAAARVASLPEDGPDHLRQVITTLSSVLVESLVEHPEERLVLGGTANLARQGADATSLRGVLEALEEQVVVLRLLTESSDPAQVTVRIGEENEAEEMWATSTVSIGYGPLSTPGEGAATQ